MMKIDPGPASFAIAGIMSGALKALLVLLPAGGMAAAFFHYGDDVEAYGVHALYIASAVVGMGSVALCALAAASLVGTSYALAWLALVQLLKGRLGHLVRGRSLIPSERWLNKHGAASSDLRGGNRGLLTGALMLFFGAGFWGQQTLTSAFCAAMVSAVAAMGLADISYLTNPVTLLLAPLALLLPHGFLLWNLAGVRLQE